MFKRVRAIALRLVHDQKRWPYSIVIVNHQLVVVQTSSFLGQNLLYTKSMRGEHLRCNKSSSAK